MDLLFAFKHLSSPNGVMFPLVGSSGLVSCLKGPMTRGSLCLLHQLQTYLTQEILAITSVFITMSQEYCNVIKKELPLKSSVHNTLHNLIASEI